VQFGFTHVGRMGGRRRGPRARAGRDAERALMLTDGGVGLLTIFGARLVGNHARRFQVIVNLPRTLLPGKDTTLIVHSCPASSPPRRAV
jgi:hypothetical protein